MKDSAFSPKYLRMNKIKFPVVKRSSSVLDKSRALHKKALLGVSSKHIKSSSSPKIEKKVRCCLCLMNLMKKSFINNKNETYIKCVNCSKHIHFECLMSITKILETLISEQYDAETILNAVNFKNNVIDNWTCFECRCDKIKLRDGGEKAITVKNKCKICGIYTEEKAMNIVLEKFGVSHLICILLPKHLLLNQTQKNKRICYLCKASTNSKLIKCDFDETECDKHFHLLCALSATEHNYHWISFRFGPILNNNLAQITYKTTSPIIRCSVHSKIAKEHRKFINSDSKNFPLFIDNFVFDQSNVNHSDVCSVCFTDTHSKNDLFLVCENPWCELLVHQRCYGEKNFPENNWFCDACENNARASAQCGRCNFKGGALKKVCAQNIKPYFDWIHVGCAILDPEIIIKNPEKMNDIFYQKRNKNIENNKNYENNENDENNENKISPTETCLICGQTTSFGVLIKCSQKQCGFWAHAMCALQSSSFQVEFRVNFRCSEKMDSLGEKIVFAENNVKLLIKNEVSKVKGVVYCEEHKKSGVGGDKRGAVWVVFPKVKKADEVEYGSSFSPLKRYFDVENAKNFNDLSKKLNFSQSTVNADWTDSLREEFRPKPPKKYSKLEFLGVLKIIEQLELLSPQNAFKNAFKKLILTKTSVSNDENENDIKNDKNLHFAETLSQIEHLFGKENLDFAFYAFKKFGSPHSAFVYQCTDALCLKNSEFMTFCYFCGSKPLIKRGKSDKNVFSENGKNGKSGAVALNINDDLDKIKKNGEGGGATLRESLILKSLALILKLCEKNGKRKQVKRNGGDVLFLLRNLCLNVVPGSLVEEKLMEIVMKIKNVVTDVTKIHDNSTSADLLVFLELVHSLKSIHPKTSKQCESFENEICQIKTTLGRLDARSIISIDLKSKFPPLIQFKKCLKCHRFAKNSPNGAKKCRFCKSAGLQCGASADIDSVCASMIWLSVFKDVGVPFVTRGTEADFDEIFPFIKAVKPYRNIECLGEDLFKKQCYLITHLVFIVTNGKPPYCSWGEFSAPVDALKEEFLFLLCNMNAVVALKDPEIVGEFLHCLRLFGICETHPAIMSGVNFLVKLVKKGKGFKKGGWVSSTDFYTMYHAAYCAVLGLADRKILAIKQMGEEAAIEWKSKLM